MGKILPALVKEASTASIIFFIFLTIFPQYSRASDEVELDSIHQTSNNDSETLAASVAENSEKIADLMSRIRSLENQLRSANKTIERSVMSTDVARKASELASDAWDIAVEARAIALRAEQKADQSLDR